ncbi:MAG TPA: SulP family inorganic anion transporter [Alphaproteobacteria bacterium]|nr:SulP family inorganic anion transporter [Alphaproteobacteria bacterium]
MPHRKPAAARPAQPRPFPLATALLSSLKNYSPQKLRADLIAGLVVSLIALPLAMALSIAVGLPPEHGLYTAIVAGIVAAIFGGSATQVSGPTAAFVVIVAPIVAKYGLHGLIWCQIMAGIVLIALGMLRLGKFVNYVPYPVVTGFTAGIAVTIATLALNDFLGLGIGQLEGHYIDKARTIIAHLPNFRWPDFTVGMVTLAGLVFTPRVLPKMPAAVVGISLGLGCAWVLQQSGFAVDTLLSRFSYTDAAGQTQAGIPPYAPSLHLPGDGKLFAVPDYAAFKSLLMPALVIAALAALESLLSATVADGIARTRHDPNAELNGIGLANIFSGLAAGVPATGAIARTAANIQAGAQSPLASVFHALFLLLYVLTLAPYISHIPMAALAALLLGVAWRMSHAPQFVMVLKLAPRSDSVVLMTCFLLTVFIDMVAGITVGMVMASLLFMRRVAVLTDISVHTSDSDDSLPEHVLVYRIDGPLFFGTIGKTLESSIATPQETERKIVVDLTHVPMIDMTGMMAMTVFLNSLVRGGRDVTLCGKAHVTDKILLKLQGTAAEGRVHTLHKLKDALR